MKISVTHFKVLLVSLLVALLIYPLALAHAFYRRTWCLYDVPDEIKSILATTTGEVRAFITKQAQAREELEERYRELSTRTLDLEQKITRHPTGSEGGSDDVISIRKAWEESVGVKAVMKHEATKAVFNFESKALFKSITSAISGGYIAAADRSATIIFPAERKLRIRNLLPSQPTDAGMTEFVRELVYSNNAGVQGGATSPTVAGGEGELKPESDMTLELVQTTVKTISHGFTVARQALADSNALMNYVESRGIYGWNLELEDELLNSDGTAGELSGLIANATAFSGGATNITAPDVIRKAVTQLALANHEATGVVLNPRDLEGLELLKDTTGQYLSVVMYVNGQPIIWRIAVVESNTMPTGKFLCGAFDQAARLRPREDAHLEVSLDHKDYRARNLVYILIEGRVGLEVFRPSALVYGNLSYSG